MNLENIEEINKFKSSINILKTRIIRNIARQKTSKVDEELFSNVVKDKDVDALKTYTDIKKFDSSPLMQSDFARKNINGWIKKQVFNFWRRVKYPKP